MPTKERRTKYGPRTTHILSSTALSGGSALKPWVDVVTAEVIPNGCTLCCWVRVHGVLTRKFKSAACWVCNGVARTHKQE